MCVCVCVCVCVNVCVSVCVLHVSLGLLASRTLTERARIAELADENATPDRVHLCGKQT